MRHLFPFSIFSLPGARRYAEPAPEVLWRLLYFFNLYRLLLGSLLVFLMSVFGDALFLGLLAPSMFFRASLIYVLMSAGALLAVRLRRPGFAVQLGLQVGTDIVIVVLLLHASGGVQSGLGSLLLVSLAAAGLVSRGRITLFFAALASIAVLLQHAYAVLTQDAAIAQFLQAGLLSVACFTVAWVAHTLAQYALASEKLAMLRGMDLANMAEANRLVIQDLPDGVLVVDEHGAVKQHNPGAERLLGVAFSDQERRPLRECAPLLAERFDAWRKNPEQEESILNVTATHQQVRVRFLPVQRESFRGAVLFIEDMRQIQAQAQQIKLAALGRLTANIAHEIRNPLSSISYAAELLQEGKPDPEQVRLLQIILDNVARMNNIVLDVLQLNRRDRMRREGMVLSARINAFVEGLRNSEGVAAEVISVDIMPDCEARFDGGHFDQVLWNLCRNALRYCRMQPGSVRIKAWCPGQQGAIMEISNDGPPVSPEAVQQLFEPFFTTDAGGTGLGLYIARELCEANGAWLGYRQPDEGGACFRIEFGRNDGR